LKDFEDRGGTWECLESGYLSSLLEQDRLKQQREKAEHKRIVVGLNAFSGDEGPINAAILDNAVKTPTVEERLARIEELKEFRKSRDQEALAEGLRRLYLDVKDKTKNCNRAMIDAVKAGATVGEFCGVVRMGYGLDYDFSGLTKAPEHVLDALKDLKVDIPLICGGLMDVDDIAVMKKIGVKGCYRTGSTVEECLDDVEKILA